MFLIRTLFLAANLCSLINSASGHLIKPRITLHNGHISLYDELLQRDLRGSITPGMPYSLDITLVETHRFDYLIQQCLYNGRSRFIDNSGCFSGDGIFIKKWETTQYNIPRAVKRTIVHFVPQEPVIYIECLVKIIECCGCAEQACERRPLLSMFNQYKETLVLSTRTSGVGVGIPGNQDLVGPGSGQRNTSSGIPWWVWLLLGLLLLLLLLLLFCAICFWCKKCGKTKKEGAVVQKPLPPAPTVPIKTPSEAPTLTCDELSASVSRAESALIATVQDPVDYHIHMDRRRAQRREEDGLRNKLEQHLHTHNRFPTVDGRSYLGSQIRSHLAQHNQDFPTSVNGETFRGETEQIMRQSPIII
ncbi:hypothetical protein L596_003940 [Steinernema carpocapsae]|uniref:ZP domain-containing protein n=1 Tax=Steinernema carpocapsae TaxID=34508 RepID=A0A4U8UU08_STECR|nr:hypothetical protein L596_003940 [Steinernema carpocapsae]